MEQGEGKGHEGLTYEPGEGTHRPRGVEWLWEDFGIRVRRSWDDVIKAVVDSDEVLPQDLAAFMISMGVEPDEGAWDVVPVARGVRGPREPEESGSN